MTLDECKQLCLANNVCRAFTYNTKVQWCFLKSDYSRIIPFEGAVAGKVVAVSSEPDLGAPPVLDFLPSGYAASAGNPGRASIHSTPGQCSDTGTA